MPNNTKRFIEQINDISRQLLSRILSVQTSLQPTQNESSLESTEEQPSNEELTDLVTARQILITNLFEQNTSEDISSHMSLLQEMLTLDSELTTNSASCKQEIAEQVLNLKKSKKVSKSYQNLIKNTNQP
ncbi:MULTISPECIES: flagellar protein FliT [unclassified Colwellia]|uniref:flagellar protein FliT n=1 Tax=unclassified Colwellia TaxID=196834 RepID=UPI0015F77B82|nr:MULTISPECIES: flagellar protein FliT [unclassified Colwellia]MBA6379047.1 flagellar protein FliT [Colwellia sp. BRX10-7]MBA6382183.1 flagellar protein FliT [Colwellia sp. BRX10-9]MBA6387231.1 flagellar protein FliT [Colwellia sp. BRX10-2]MBA6394285.1 flagellar protein FliT [Colwellia sp. BRX10-6]MBA6400104.1 flagellar protein FliT [Colwellia sp. BRX10-5]